MKTITLLVAMLLPIIAQATQPRLMKVTLPLWYKGAAESDQTILISEVPRICGGTDAAAWFALFSQPLRPDGAQVDVNLISLYKIGISADQDRDGSVTRIVIDTSKAAKPPNYPFEIEGVTDQVVICIRREFPDKERVRIVIAPDEQERSGEEPKTEQGGRGQPATRPESK
jgi:hypothetical protein